VAKSKIDIDVGDRVELVFPDTTLDGELGTVRRVFRMREIIGGRRPDVFHYDVEIDSGGLLHPAPVNVKKVGGGK
jgi:hypothetical protein